MLFRSHRGLAKPPSALQSRPYAVDHVQKVQSQASPTLRTPSKALVGGKEGRDIKPRHQEVKKVRVAEEEEVEEKRVESRPKEQAKRREEEQQSSAGQPVGGEGEEDLAENQKEVWLLSVPALRVT